MSQIKKYIKDFKRFNANTSSEYRAEAAPHQPILLLALIKLHKEGKIDLKSIKPDSKDLLSTVEEVWNDWLGYKEDFKIQYPLYHLQTKDFWDYNLKEGYDFVVRKGQTPTFKKIRERVDVFYINDANLIGYLEDEYNRKKLINALLRSGRVLKTTGEKKYCFTDQEKQIIKQKMGI